MPQQFGGEFTHGTYDEEHVQECLANQDFMAAFTTVMQVLSSALLANPKTEDFARAREILLSIDVANDWPFGAKDTLARVAQELADGAQETEHELVVEYTRLFRGPAALPAPPWGSVYMDRDKVMYGWTWVELRNWLREHGIEGTYEDNDPEDNFARLLALAATLATERPALLAEFLADHLLCWSSRFLELLEPACTTHTYRALALLAKATLEDIQQQFGIEPAPRTLRR